MSKVRVYEVAKELGVSNRDLVALFQSLGFSGVRNHMSAVEAEDVERVKRKLERQRTPEAREERIRPTVVKRRGRAVAPAPAAPAKAGEPAVVEAMAAAVREKAEPVAVPPPPAPEPEPVRPQAPRAPEPPLAAEALMLPEAEPSRPAALPAEAPGVEPAPPPAGPAELAFESQAEREHTEEPAASPAQQAQPAPDLAVPPAPLAAAGEASAADLMDGADAALAGADAGARRAAPHRTGIEVWEGRPGVPMPQRLRPAIPPTARRTTYDPRAGVAGARPTVGYAGRTLPGRPMRPGFRRAGLGGTHQRKGPAAVSTKEMSTRKMVIKIEGETSLQNLAAKMSLKATDVLMKLIGMGVAGVNINSTLDSDTANLLASEFGWTIADVSVDEQSSLDAAIEAEGEELGEMALRPPIVTVMGHVDHGKTTLLDTIRNASVAASEAGGITQHIGAYRVDTAKGPITFLDTPGHEAFTAMRARGAEVTDIVVLVVAADDGVMPQTREAINHARSAGVPIIVAVNKIDKPGVDPDRIVRDLSAEGLAPEDWGGETIFCRVSALRGEGVERLLEMILLQAEMLELGAHPARRARGVVIESLLDRGRGPVARVVVQDGTLTAGEVVLAGAAYGKVRAMTDEKGRKLREAGPSTPVEVLGLNEVPSAGDPFYAVKNIRAAETIASDRKKKVSKSLLPQDSRVSLEALTSKLAEGQQLELKVIIKADVQGSVEALEQALTKLSTEKVKLTVVHTGVGGVTESDVNLAVASKAIIIGFGVRPAGKAKKCAEDDGVEIRLYEIIYEVIDDVRAAMEGLLPATRLESVLGRAEVRQTFRIAKVGLVAGCMVATGLIRRSAQARLIRDDVVIWTGRLASLRRFKDDAKEVREDQECGLSLEGYSDVKEKDVLESFEVQEVKATL
ncbi:MAG: translation initiation factor IF-2 [Deltaproteobacteria bacterium]|nr:translation initiation factor IF-2 [Deltaproteobacteria bacterium]